MPPTGSKPIKAVKSLRHQQPGVEHESHAAGVNGAQKNSQVAAIPEGPAARPIRNSPTILRIVPFKSTSRIRSPGLWGCAGAPSL